MVSFRGVVDKHKGLSILLYPAMRTLRCSLACSETRLPIVWSSFLMTKSEQLGMAVARLVLRPDTPVSCYIPVKGISSIFFSSSPRVKSSNLLQG